MVEGVDDDGVSPVEINACDNCSARCASNSNNYLMTVVQKVNFRPVPASVWHSMHSRISPLCYLLILDFLRLPSLQIENQTTTAMIAVTPAVVSSSQRPGTADVVARESREPGGA